MEAYRGYPDDRGYPEGGPPEPGYGDSPPWYGERRDPPPPDPLGPDPLGYDSPRRDHGPPTEPPRGVPTQVDPLDPVRAGRPHPEPARAAAPVGSPGVVSSPPRPGPVPGEEPSFSRRPVSAPGSAGPSGDGVYRSRRPAVAALVGLPAAVLEIPALLLLIDASFGDELAVSGVISASCLVLALPLLAMGLYAVATGAVRAAGPNSVQAWLRPPVAYLTVGLVLFIAAGLAA